MKKINKEKLIEELKEFESSNEKIGEMVFFAEKMSDIPSIWRSYSVKKSFIRRLETKEKIEKEIKTVNKRQQFWPHLFFAPVVAVLLLFIGSASIVGAQDTIPGDIFYPVKRVSEEAISIVNPEFKNEILGRRSIEIEKLVEQEKHSNLIKSTIKDYKDNIKNKNLNSLKLQESKKRLEIVKEKSPKYKEEIEGLIRQLADEIDKEVIKDNVDAKEAKNENIKGVENISKDQLFHDKGNKNNELGPRNNQKN